MAKVKRYRVIQADKIPVGARKILRIEDRSIGIFNVNGTFIAVLNLCPHQFAPVCQGRVSGTTAPSQPGEMNWVRDGEILYCPWHGWEFDLLTGDCLTDYRRLRRFATTVEDGWVVLELRSGAAQ
jgi:3-phenylpropionate/trans-cinnamate dioxygenase ferredoxin subunit